MLLVFPDLYKVGQHLKQWKHRCHVSPQYWQGNVTKEVVNTCEAVQCCSSRRLGAIFAVLPSFCPVPQHNLTDDVRVQWWLGGHGR